MKALLLLIVLTLTLGALAGLFGHAWFGGLSLVFAMTFSIIAVPVFFATPENMVQNTLKEDSNFKKVA